MLHDLSGGWTATLAFILAISVAQLLPGVPARATGPSDGRMSARCEPRSGSWVRARPGLLLAHLLGRDGIESVVVERRSREHLERRVRAGVLEQGTTDLLDAAGVGERMRREGMVHHGIELRFGGDGHRIDFAALTGGHGITVYGQQEVVKDLLAAREAAGALPLFECEDVEPAGLDGDRPAIRFTHAGERHELRASRRRLRRLRTASAARRCRTARSSPTSASIRSPGWGSSPRWRRPRRS